MHCVVCLSHQSCCWSRAAALNIGGGVQIIYKYFYLLDIWITLIYYSYRIKKNINYFWILWNIERIMFRAKNTPLPGNIQIFFKDQDGGI